MDFAPIKNTDIIVIAASIDFFISSTIAEYSPDKKREINSYARRIKKKLLKHDPNITLNELHSACICLYHLRDTILNNDFNNDLDIKFKTDSEKYLSQIDDLIEQFAEYLLAFGVNIFA